MSATASDTPRRQSLTKTDQQPLVQLARGAGAEDVKQFSVINGFAASMSPAAQDLLAADPRVRAVVPDRVIKLPSPVKRGGAGTGAPDQRICPSDPAEPLLEPEALQLTHTAFEDRSVPQAQNLATGKGVKVAFLADGIDIDNADFVRPDGSRVIVDYQDFTGEGVNAPTAGGEAFGDASSIAAQGRRTYDLADFAHPASPLPKGCTIRIRGISPGASLVALKVLSDVGGSTSSIVQGVEYAVTVARVDVINESLGAHPVPDNQNDPLSLANRAAVAAGITVTAASGDAGINGTVGAPAGDPQVISVGASTSQRIFAQLRRNMPGFRGGWVSDNVAAISSAGITERAEVIDLVAPGNSGWSVCTPDVEMFASCIDAAGEPSPIREFGGTSQSAPFTAGAAALVIEAYAATHRGVKPSPALIKRILTSTATDQNDPADRQGAGLLNTLQAVLAAQSIQDSHGTSQPKGDNLLVDRTQLSVTAAQGAERTVPLRVTNIGANIQAVKAHNRVLNRTVSDERGSATLDARSPGAATWVDEFGTRRAFVTRTFTVPPGAAHLDASIAFTPPTPRAVTLRLLDPDGRIVGDSSPQDPGGFGHMDVHNPTPGRWTAIFDAIVAANGFRGTVRFGFRTSAYGTIGTVTPAALVLRPDESGTFHVTADIPERAGDLSAAVQLDSSSRDRRLAVPLTLRGLISTKGGKGTFSGVLTGGNGREEGPAQATPLPLRRAARAA
ncbi:S8 family serine peptidase [Lentzea sp. PSKA42]|uniref:S8 family serine peptidase n=1 Tax=Lentzea indica TaxID=2604800 RepID=A0ABX1FRJ4_9PSEU|nr:S8 family serine peptidase [Lentzea indica]